MSERRRPDVIEGEMGKMAVKYVDVKPIGITREQMRAIHPKYRIPSDLLMTEGRVTRGFDVQSMELAGICRNPVLEGMKEGKIIPSEIADANFQEMERATALKWYTSLARLFASEKFQKFPMHRTDGRMNIAIPGCHLGFEIGGVLDFFNAQGIAADIDAVDVNTAGAEQPWMHLGEREHILGSRVNFHSKTDARSFFDRKRTDIAILRHPGFVFEPDQYHVWKEIVKKIVATKPGVIIVSTYHHKLEDPVFADLVHGRPEASTLYEGDIFRDWLIELGYADDDHTYVMDDKLEYPLSPYMLAYQVEEGKMRFTVPVDRNIEIYGSKEYFSVEK